MASMSIEPIAIIAPPPAASDGAGDGGEGAFAAILAGIEAPADDSCQPPADSAATGDKALLMEGASPLALLPPPAQTDLPADFAALADNLAVTAADDSDVENSDDAGADEAAETAASLIAPITTPLAAPMAAPAETTPAPVTAEAADLATVPAPRPALAGTPEAPAKAGADTATDEQAAPRAEARPEAPRPAEAPRQGQAAAQPAAEKPGIFTPPARDKAEPAIDANRPAGDAGAARADQAAALSTAPARGTEAAKAHVQAAASSTAPAPALQLVASVSRAVREGVDRMTVELQPEHLGKIELRIDVTRDGRVNAMILADKPDTLQLLQKDARALERALSGAGIETGGGALGFDLRGNNQQGQGRFEGKGRARLELTDPALPAEASPEEIILPGRIQAGRVNIRV